MLATPNYAQTPGAILAIAATGRPAECNAENFTCRRRPPLILSGRENRLYRTFLESAIRCGYQGGMRREAFSFLAAALTASAQAALASAAVAGPHDELIAKHAAANGVPEHLVRRVIRVESGGNAASVHAGNYGLMQIRLGTARGLGYSGEAKGLLDPDTNLTYAVKYLAGAYRAAGCDADRAVSLYMRGYYRVARRDCGVVQIAQAQPKPADVIKPKVVRTEIITTLKSGQAPARPVGKFEPARTAPAPVAVAIAVPLPRVRPEFDVAPTPAVEATKLPQRKPKRAENRLRAVAHAKIESKPAPDSKFKIEDPAGVVTFLKKLVTPDKKARKPAVEAEADPPSQAQPPQ
jgi:hypothetical protein